MAKVLERYHKPQRHCLPWACYLFYRQNSTNKNSFPWRLSSHLSQDQPSTCVAPGSISSFLFAFPMASWAASPVLYPSLSPSLSVLWDSLPVSGCCPSLDSQNVPPDNSIYNILTYSHESQPWVHIGITWKIVINIAAKVTYQTN